MRKGYKMKKLIFTFLLLLVLPLSMYAETPYQLEWRPQNPFRFFKESKVYWEMKEIYDNVDKNHKGLAFERALQSKKWKKEDSLTKGWADYFAKNRYAKTHWNQNRMMYDDNYVNPNSYAIEVKLNNISKEEKCKWSINSKIKAISVCSEFTPLEIEQEDKNSILTYEIVGKNQKGQKAIKLEDIIIVGLGDSYASGEGNPDTPAIFSQNRVDKDAFLVKSRYFPRKDKNGSAKWLDRRCHRSLYSYQFKTALQYSLEHPKKFVTFVSFSCTGAKSEHIIDTYKKAAEYIDSSILHLKPRYLDKTSGLEILDGKENTTKDRTKTVRPQIDALNETLKDKKADILLLSIGGNDIGFAGYVMNVLLKKGWKRATKKTKYELYSTLSENYYRLDKKLKKFIKDEDNKRILLTAYPKVLQDENGKLCKGDRGAFDIPFGITEKREERVKDTQTYLTIPLYKIQKELAQEIGWTFIDAHRSKFEKHGFCAKDKDNPESFLVPHKIKKDDDWIPYNPRDTRYRAYRKKQRWFQLPMDSILMINQTKDFLWFESDLGFSDEKSGIMHPSADGLAVEADANIDAIEYLLQ